MIAQLKIQPRRNRAEIQAAIAERKHRIFAFIAANPVGVSKQQIRRWSEYQFSSAAIRAAVGALYLEGLVDIRGKGNGIRYYPTVKVWAMLRDFPAPQPAAPPQPPKPRYEPMQLSKFSESLVLRKVWSVEPLIRPCSRCCDTWRIAAVQVGGHRRYCVPCTRIHLANGAKWEGAE